MFSFGIITENFEVLKFLIMTFLLQSFVGGRGEVEWNSVG